MTPATPTTCALALALANAAQKCYGSPHSCGKCAVHCNCFLPRYLASHTSTSATPRTSTATSSPKH